VCTQLSRTQMEGWLRYILEEETREESPSAARATVLQKASVTRTTATGTAEKPIKERNRSPRKQHGIIVDVKANAMASSSPSATAEETLTRSPSQLHSITRVSSFKKSSPSPLRRFSSNASLDKSAPGLKRKATHSSDSSDLEGDGERDKSSAQEETLAYFKLTETQLLLASRQKEVRPCF
jgi:hypothetical protein